MYILHTISSIITYLSIEMQTTMLLDRNKPKMRKKEQTRHRISPAHQETVMAQMISNGIIRNTTYKIGNRKVKKEVFKKSNVL